MIKENALKAIPSSSSKSRSQIFEMFTQVQAFYATAQLALSHIIESDLHPSLGSASVALAAFSLELGFKSLIFDDDLDAKLEGRRGHSLYFLFRRLKKEDRGFIVKASMKSEKPIAIPRSEKDVINCFRIDANAFVDWRYSFEKDRLRADQLVMMRATKACIDLFAKRHPSRKCWPLSWPEIVQPDW